MKIIIDTNIILDVLCNRKDFVNDSLKIFKLCETRQIQGCISALSIANIVYIMRKELDFSKIKEILSKLSLIFEIIDLESDDLIKASLLKFNDYEDSIQSGQASRVKADYIVTRNVKDFNNSRVLALKPNELIERI